MRTKMPKLSNGLTRLWPKITTGRQQISKAIE
jgi:hypothetical protein